MSAMHKISKISQSEYLEVVEVWEASVRATHHFLNEGDVELFKPLILNDYLKAVELYCVRNKLNKILAFLGLADGKIEMLFVHPDEMGKGIGKALLICALQEGVTKVDVNEANEQATEFYRHMGFNVVKRSELDGMGKPYPILYMEIQKRNN